ncbi:hypothetical protein ElyMa_003975600 [Elysia marginata]|uniref:Uncharacterized protein n=1 Tax=Elysia marginata TaxID=1093978 RepID=A0AAV4FX11_9GAST|nr:hypothetical protein ElyMa_003975600 [Elysia marginata]
MGKFVHGLDSESKTLKEGSQTQRQSKRDFRLRRVRLRDIQKEILDSDESDSETVKKRFLDSDESDSETVMDLSQSASIWHCWQSARLKADDRRKGI